MSGRDRADFEVTIVGGGAVGLACAAELAEAGRRVLLVERGRGFGLEASSRNSEVVHAGFYYPPGSLKARSCVEGRRILERAAAEGSLPLARTGKLVLALREDEEPRLDELLERGRANGVEGLELVGRRRLAELEPGVKARAALWSPASGVTSAHGLVEWLRRRAAAAGADLAPGLAVTSLEREAGAWSVETQGVERHRSSWVLNAAGLHADSVLELAGLDPDALGLRLHWSKGCWFSLAASSAVRASRLVYPLPPADGSGLGVHLTVDLGGRRKLGPDTEPVARREQARLEVDPGRRRFFFEAARPWLAGLREEDLAPDQAGFRARLSAPGEPPRDFVIRNDEGLVSLLGIESPGLTAAPGLARAARRAALEAGLPA